MTRTAVAERRPALDGRDPRAPEWRPNPKRDCQHCRCERPVEPLPDGYRCLKCDTTTCTTFA